MKRCKGCIFWLPYDGSEDNPVLRRMQNLEAPRRARRACLLRLREVPGKDGAEATLVPSFSLEHDAGPRYGHRVSPNAVCKHHTAKHPPHKRPRTQTTELPALPVGAVVVADFGAPTVVLDGAEVSSPVSFE